MRIISTIHLLVFAILTVACNDMAKKPKLELTEDNSILIKHQMDEVRVPLNPERVILFDFGALDSFDELGLSKSLVGLPKHTMPKYLNKFKEDTSIKNVGNLMEPNFQIINELEPDLIIIGLRQVSDYKEFAAIAPTIIYELDYEDYIGSVDKNVKQIGKIFQIQDQANDRLNKLHENLEHEKNKIDNDTLRGLIVMYNDGKFSAYGKGSRFGLVHDFFNIPAVVENLEVSRHGNSISTEFIQEHNPDLLYVLDRNAAITNEDIHKESIENNLIKQTAAYKNGKIVYLSPDVWYLSGGGIKSLEIMAKEVGSSL
ncbi:MAG TPA: ABC transporter substrate-binding protein [Flavobacteriaceae bacterium]|nr:ABC transporter substrate-binding protein [Flavobacteriaceae bacterium]